MNLQNGKKRIVVKIGTSTLTHSTGKANIALIAKLASVLSDLKMRGIRSCLYHRAQFQSE